MINRKVLAAVACMFTAMSAGAINRPDFSGSWKLNIEKSELGPMPPPSSMTQIIEQKEPSLRVAITIKGGPQGDLQYEAKYTTDGKESINRLAGREAKSKVTWDGNVLTLNTKADFGGGDVTIKSRWKLSGSGKILTQSADMFTPQGDFHLTYLFEKQ